MLLMTSVDNIDIIKCRIRIGDYEVDAITWFDLTLYVFCATFWYIWCKNVCTRKCSCCKYFAIGVIILVGLLGLLGRLGLFYISLINYNVSQILIPVILGSLMSKIPQNCDSCKRVTECSCCQKIGIWIVIGVVCIASQVGVLLYLSGWSFIAYGLFWYELSCFGRGAIVWLNPCFIILNIALLFSNA
eukprot:408944_1